MKQTVIRSIVVLTVLMFLMLTDPVEAYFVNMSNNIGIPTATTPHSGHIAVGSPVTLYALPPDGYMFINWSGDLQGVADPYSWKITVSMTKDRNIMAIFAPTKHIVMNTRGFIHASPLLYDINHDGFKEVIVGDMAGYVYCFDHLGNKLWEYYAGDAFNKDISPVADWFSIEMQDNNNIGNVTIQSSCAAGDVDGDGVPDIVVGVGGFADLGTGGARGTTTGFGPVGQGGILILSNSGSLKLLIRSWDTFDGLGNPSDGLSDGIVSTPALADFDGDGKLDFVVGGLDQNIHAFRLEAQDTSKDSLGNKVKHFRMPGKDGLWPAPISEFDDDGDGEFNEDPSGCLTPVLDYSEPTCDDDHDGGPVDEDEFEWPFRATDTIISSPAVSDVTGDGILDIVIGTDCSGGIPTKLSRKQLPLGGVLRVLNTRAEEIGLFPQWTEQVLWSSPAIVDIDNDGNKEIFVGTGIVVSDANGFKGKALYAFNSDGSPYFTGTTPHGLFAATSDTIFSSPAIGDVNGDGHLEIIVADFSTTTTTGGYLYAFDENGQSLPGFPMLPLQEFAANLNNPMLSHQNIRSSPILADVDGDGIPEIIIGAGWSIVAVKGDGTLVPEFRYGHTCFTTGTTSVYASPAAADLDNNGRIDLVWATGKSSNGGSRVDNGEVHIWELGAFNKLANPWPAFKRSGTRTSSFTLQLENPVFSPTVSEVEAGDILIVSVEVYPGISPLHSIHFDLAINGSLLQIPMVDDGTSGDAVASDGRYTGCIQLPQSMSSIGGISFTAQALNGETTTLKSGARFQHSNILNLVTMYYNNILGRAPDEAGLDNWLSEIERITSLGIDIKEGFIALAKLFFNSTEYLLRNATNQQYVTDLYVTFLNRTPDAAGLASWVHRLSQGLTRDMLISEFANSAEFELYLDGIFVTGGTRPENNLVNDFYRGILNRLPDSAGFNYWLGQMRTAQCSGSAQQIRDLSYQLSLLFIQSTEYGLRNRSDSQFIEDLYNAILRRGGDPAGFVGWVNALRTQTRTQVLQAFTSCAEFQFRVTEVINAGCYP
jgi:hypothetical protein